jgi:hypothetical protein
MVCFYFLAAAIPSVFGIFGHSYSGEKKIFPRLTKSKDIDPLQFRILRLVWHSLSLTFATNVAIIVLLGQKEISLSQFERQIIRFIMTFYIVLGSATICYWGIKLPQGYLFIITAGLLDLGLRQQQ